MKKNYLIIIPMVFLLFIGSFSTVKALFAGNTLKSAEIIPVQGAMVKQPEKVSLVASSQEAEEVKGPLIKETQPQSAEIKTKISQVEIAQPDRGSEDSLPQPEPKEETQETPKNNTGAMEVKVEGSPAFLLQIKAALELLKTRDGVSYAKANQYLIRIVENENSGVDVYSKTFYIGKGTVQTGDPYWLAGVIVHDAYHSELYYQGLPFTGAQAEEACNQRQKAALKAIGAPEHYLEYLDQVNQSEYWEVPFEQRSW